MHYYSQHTQITLTYEGAVDGAVLMTPGAVTHQVCFCNLNFKSFTTHACIE